MRVEEEVAVRNAGLLLAQRGAKVVAVALFAALVPRLMGPEVYGRYKLVTSISLWFVFASALGSAQVMCRFVPQFSLKERDLKDFFERLLTVRLFSGALAAGSYLLLCHLWLRELDPLVLAILAGAAFVQAVSQLFFALLLGLNRAAHWGMGQIARGWASLVLVLLGVLLDGLRGACLALLLTELLVLSLGASWARPHIAWPRPRTDVRQLAPYVRFALTFFASDLLLAAFRPSGEAMVRAVSGDYAQVGYFGLAYDVYLIPGLVVPQLTLAIAPLLTTLSNQHRDGTVRLWLERLLKGLAIGGMLALFGALVLADDLVPFVLGAAYQPVATNLLPLVLTLLPLTLSSVGRLLALVYDRPEAALAGEGLRLGAFWLLGPPLVAWRGSLGGCLAVLASSVLHSAYLTWRMQDVVRYSLRAWALAIALGGALLPLAWLRSSLMVNVGLYGAFAVAYGCALLLLRVVTPGEVAAAWRAMSSRGQGIESA